MRHEDESGQPDAPSGCSAEPGDPNRRSAVSLMRMALALLDRAGELHGAAHLQHAIDTVLRAPRGAQDAAEINRVLGTGGPGDPATDEQPR